VEGDTYHQIAEPAADNNAVVSWPAPPTQGAGWLFEIFTPPEVYFDPSTGKFRLTRAPATSVALPQSSAGFGIILHEVVQEAFPLQLVGYVGEGDRLLGTFENRNSFETLLLRGGDDVKSLGLVLEQVTVGREATRDSEGEPFYETRAKALVRDRRSGVSTVLQQGVTLLTERRHARISWSGSDGDELIVREGDVIEQEGARYTIEKIQLAPAAVDVTKEALHQSSPIRRTLFLTP